MTSPALPTNDAEIKLRIPQAAKDELAKRAVEEQITFSAFTRRLILRSLEAAA